METKETARTMYLDETPEQQRPDILTTVFRERGTVRPTKKDRRDIEKIRREDL